MQRLLRVYPVLRLVEDSAPRAIYEPGDRHVSPGDPDNVTITMPG